MNRSATRSRWPDAVVIAVLAGILYASLSRSGTVDCSRLATLWLRESLGAAGSDVIGNVFAYLLLGGAIGIAWLQRQRPRRRWAGQLRAGAATVLACIALSVSMETAQACFSGRVSSVIDVLDNTLGAAMGWMAAMLLSPAWSWVSPMLAPGARERRLLAVVGLAWLAWLAARCVPWSAWLATPSPLGTTDLSPLQGDWLAALANPPGLLRDTAQFLAVCAGLSLPWRRRRAACAAIGLVLLVTGAAGVVMPRASFSAHTWLALPLAAALSTLLVWVASPRTRAAVMLCAAVVAIVFFELRAGTGAAAPFSWRPLVFHGNALRGMQQALFFGWFGLSVMAAGSLVGGARTLWLLGAPLLLGALEAAQTLLPGRTPDLSPPLLVLAAAACAAGLLAPTKRR